MQVNNHETVTAVKLASISECEGATAKLTVTPERVDIKLPTQFSDEDRKLVTDFFQTVIAEMGEVQQSWRGRVKPYPGRNPGTKELTLTMTTDRALKKRVFRNYAVPTSEENKARREALKTAKQLERPIPVLSVEDEACLARITTSGQFTLDKTLGMYAGVRRESDPK